MGAMPFDCRPPLTGWNGVRKRMKRSIFYKWEQGQPQSPPLVDPIVAYGAVIALDFLVEIPQFPDKIYKEQNKCSQ